MHRQSVDAFESVGQCESTSLTRVKTLSREHGAYDNRKGARVCPDLAYITSQVI